VAGQREFISQIGASITEKRCVDSENQRFEASIFGASYQIYSNIPVSINIELEPLYTLWRSFRHFLYAARGYR